MIALNLRKIVLAVAGVSVMASSIAAAEPAKVILLGSGTPVPDPSSSGPAVAVVAGGRSYLFDAGPGVVRRAQAAAEKFGLPPLDATRLTRLFFTHLHSDHTLGYPDVIFTPWVVGRREPLEVFGPVGIAAMTEHLRQAYAADVKIRTEGLESLSRRGLQVNVHEIEAPEEIYRDAKVTVRAVAVPHGSWPQAFAYAIEADGRKIVISGDTAPSDAIVNVCAECDVLVHEVYSADRFASAFGAGGSRYHKSSHTSTAELAAIASKCKPKLLVLYHQLYFGPANQVDLVKEIRRSYSGAVVNGRDLTEY